MGRETETGGVGAGQAALAVIVVAGTALGALALRPGGPARGKGPWGQHGLAVAALVAGWLAAGIWLNKRYRERMGDADPRLGPVEQRLADTVRGALLVLPVALPVLLLALHPISTGGDGQPPPQVILPPNRAPLPPPPPPGSPHGHPLLPALLLGVGVLLLLALTGWAALSLWRLRRPPPLPHRTTYATADDDAQEALAQAVDSGRRALLDGDDPRAAVIACYAAMEESLAASGVARHASDSPRDLLERASADGLLTGPAAAELTALFREARYSTHPMDGSHRERASAALAGIADMLESRAAAAAGAAS